MTCHFLISTLNKSTFNSFRQSIISIQLNARPTLPAGWTSAAKMVHALVSTPSRKVSTSARPISYIFRCSWHVILPCTSDKNRTNEHRPTSRAAIRLKNKTICYVSINHRTWGIYNVCNHADDVSPVSVKCFYNHFFSSRYFYGGWKRRLRYDRKSL